MTGKVKGLWQDRQDAQGEEKFLIEQYESARWELEQATKEASYYAAQKKGAEQHLEDTKQAIIDYAEGNGILETENFSISKSYRVDIEDESAIPDEYLTAKVTKTPNKALIKGQRPQGNWYTIKEVDNVRVK